MPAVILTEDVFSLIPVAATGFGLTVTSQLARLPLGSLAATVQLPAFFAVMTPLLLTSATEVSEELHSKAVSVASEGVKEVLKP